MKHSEIVELAAKAKAAIDLFKDARGKYGELVSMQQEIYQSGFPTPASLDKKRKRTLAMYAPLLPELKVLLGPLFDVAELKDVRPLELGAIERIVEYMVDDPRAPDGTERLEREALEQLEKLHRRLKSWASEVDGDESPASSTIKQKTPRRAQKRQPTALQLEAIHAFARLDGNYSAAASELGISVTSVRQRIKAGYKNAGQTAPLSPKTTRLPSDRRGQSQVERNDARPPKD